MPESLETTITQDERTMATLAHALQVVGWWLAPLIIFLVNRKSRFVSFHALQALLLQIAYMVLMGGFMVVWLAVIFGMVAHQDTGHAAAPPTALFILMPLIWLGFMSAWISIIVVAVIYSIKAGRGEWAAYPIVGRTARRILHIDEQGMTTTPPPLQTSAGTP